MYGLLYDMGEIEVTGVEEEGMVVWKGPCLMFRGKWPSQVLGLSTLFRAHVYTTQIVSGKGALAFPWTRPILRETSDGNLVSYVPAPIRCRFPGVAL